MTVKEILYSKYEAMLKNIRPNTWNRYLEMGGHPAKHMYMDLEITADDIRQNGGWNGELWQEIESMHKAKLLASNRHRQYHGHITKYWLTEKGWKNINKNHDIC